MIELDNGTPCLPTERAVHKQVSRIDFLDSRWNGNEVYKFSTDAGDFFVKMNRVQSVATPPDPLSAASWTPACGALMLTEMLRARWTCSIRSWPLSLPSAPRGLSRWWCRCTWGRCQKSGRSGPARSLLSQTLVAPGWPAPAVLCALHCITRMCSKHEALAGKTHCAGLSVLYQGPSWWCHFCHLNHSAR
jgi:hypothetical protein